MVHAPCMRKVQREYEICSAHYRDKLREINLMKSSDQTLPLCCSLQDYFTCSTAVVNITCGNNATHFTRRLLNRMSQQLIQVKTHLTCLAQCENAKFWKIYCLLYSQK